MSLKIKVNTLVADILNMDEDDIHAELTAEETDNWDSMANLTLVTAIEEEFDISLTMDDVQSIKGVKVLYEIVCRHTDGS